MTDTNAQPKNQNGLLAFVAVGNFLSENKWYPQAIQGKSIYRVNYNGKNAQFVCYARTHVELEQFMFYVVAPVKAPPEKQAAVAEFITRANFGLRIGNFELSFKDGQIRYKSSIDFVNEKLTDQLIKNTIHPAAQTMDRYWPGLMNVIYNNKQPIAAVAEVEKR